jgi:VWFA-related protein
VITQPPNRAYLVGAFIAALVIPALALSTVRQSQVVHVESSFVQVDATVTDKNGNRIRDLKSENFQLFEDNKPQKLTAVDYCDVHEYGTDNIAHQATVSLNYADDPETLRAVAASHRLIVLFFDRTAMDPEDISRSVRAARKFVQDQMTPADLVIIATYGTQLEVNSDFTNDRATLEQALDSLMPGKQPRSADAKRTPNSSVSMKTLVRGDERSYDVDQSLDAAKALSDMLAQIPGRKSVMHFSNGFRQRGIDNIAALDAATDSANRHNVSFFEVDSRALVTLETALGRPVASARDIAAAQEMIAESRATLSTLAKETGGLLLTDTNDFQPFFKQMQDDSTGYYLLTYDSSNQKKDGQFRSVNVQLLNVPGGHITFRKGYYAPKK